MKYTIRIGLAVSFIASIVLIRLSGFHNWFTLEWLQNQNEMLQHMLATHHGYVAASYIGLYALAVILALPLMSAATIAGGFLFGVFPGALYANIGATLGATIFFLLVRTVFGTTLQKAYHARLVAFNKHVERFGAWYFIAVRSIAVVPFFVVNLLAGLTTVSLWTFVWTTALGIIPVTVILSFAGTELATVHAIQDLFSWHIMLALGALALLAIISIVVQYTMSTREL